MRVELKAADVLVYKGKTIEQDILEAILDTSNRVLWAFVAGEGGDIRAVPYNESHVIWLEASDLEAEKDIEV